MTTFAYDSATGELTGQSYSDTTPAVTFTYDRLGRNLTTGDVTGTRNFVYDPAKPWRFAAEAECDTRFIHEDFSSALAVSFWALCVC